MLQKIIISHFFTTINFQIFLKTIFSLTLRLPFLRHGKSVDIFKKDILNFLGNRESKIISFYNGRSAIFHALKRSRVGKGDEVFIQGYTCVSVSNAIIQTGAKPIYVDIDKTSLNINPKKIEEKITKKTKAIIIQHTFGNPAELEKILKVSKKYNLITIEDCAHSLGSEIDGKKVGTFGDFSIFSTGRDKVISSVTGGFLVINNKKYFKDISKIKRKLIMPTRGLVIRNLLYNIFGYLAYKTYSFGKLGKIIIFLSRKLNFVTEILSKKEKKCSFKKFNYLLPNSLAYLGKKELEKINTYNENREFFASLYEDTFKNKKEIQTIKIYKNSKNIYFGFPIIIKNPQKLLDFCRKNNILLGNYWTFSPIVPVGVNLRKANYTLGNCRVAENISNNILLLPNHSNTTIKDVKRVIETINKFYE